MMTATNNHHQSQPPIPDGWHREEVSGGFSTRKIVIDNCPFAQGPEVLISIEDEHPNPDILIKINDEWFSMTDGEARSICEGLTEAIAYVKALKESRRRKSPVSGDTESLLEPLVRNFVRDLLTIVNGEVPF